jgi:hypothetical protein
MQEELHQGLSYKLIHMIRPPVMTGSVGLMATLGFFTGRVVANLILLGTENPHQQIVYVVKKKTLLEKTEEVLELIEAAPKIYQEVKSAATFVGEVVHDIKGVYSYVSAAKNHEQTHKEDQQHADKESSGEKHEPSKGHGILEFFSHHEKPLEQPLLIEEKEKRSDPVSQASDV